MKYTNFFKFLEKKDYLISKLTSLSPEQKQEVIAFFTKHPSYESEIDWNRKDLTWEDFEEIMNKERISASQLKNFVKEGRHYLVLYKSKDLVVYQPLTWLGSRYIASKDVAPYIEGKWCTAYQKDMKHWDTYSFDKKRSFLYLCTPTTKWALEIDTEHKRFIPWDFADKKNFVESFFESISKEVPNIKNILDDLIPQAISNHELVIDSQDIDSRDIAIFEENRKKAREARIKAFSKSFLKQVRRKGYYQWDGDLLLNDLEELGLYDKETGFFDKRVSKFKVAGNVDFSKCTSKTIYLPQYIEKSFTLEKNKKLESIVIPDSITSIDSYAFYGCSALTDINIPDSVTSIGNLAFSGCSSLTDINIPDNVTEIGGGAFSGCSSLISINIPDSVTSIGNSAFYGCYAITEIVIPDSVTEIGDEAFSSCSSLTSVAFPDSVTSIGNKAFYCCLSLTSVTIGKSVTSIGDVAFWNCFSLTEITIPDSVTSIGSSLFLSCDSLKAVYIDKEKNSLDLSKAEIPSQTEIYWKGEF